MNREKNDNTVDLGNCLVIGSWNAWQANCQAIKRTRLPS